MESNLQKTIKRLIATLKIEVERVDKDIDFREDQGIDCTGYYQLSYRLERELSGLKIMLKTLKED